MNKVDYFLPKVFALECGLQTVCTTTIMIIHITNSKTILLPFLLLLSQLLVEFTNSHAANDVQKYPFEV